MLIWEQHQNKGLLYIIIQWYTVKLLYYDYHYIDMHKRTLSFHTCVVLYDAINFHFLLLYDNKQNACMSLKSPDSINLILCVCVHLVNIILVINNKNKWLSTKYLPHKSLIVKRLFESINVSNALSMICLYQLYNSRHIYWPWYNFNILIQTHAHIKSTVK